MNTSSGPGLMLLLFGLMLICTGCGDPEQREVADIVRRRAAELIQTNASGIHANKPLAAHGADEIDIVQLITAMEEEFQIEIPDLAMGTNAEDISATLTVEKLARIVIEQRAAREAPARARE
jgi:acyl carrier protein